MPHISQRIEFDYPVGSLTVRLTAEVELVADRGCYIVRNFRVPPHGSLSYLPQVELQKINGVWVHEESRKESILSQAVGEAIEKRIELSRLDDPIF